MLKISGESLAGSNEQGFDFENLNDLSNSIKKLQSKNLKISFPKLDFGLFPACPESNPLMHFPEML